MPGELQYDGVVYAPDLANLLGSNQIYTLNRTKTSEISHRFGTRTSGPEASVSWCTMNMYTGHQQNGLIRRFHPDAIGWTSSKCIFQVGISNWWEEDDEKQQTSEVLAP